VELILAAEVGEGLLTLEDRVPDLILTSPFMSPFDDGVLDEYLRDLGPRGAHVQTLRIPVLSQVPKKTARLGFSLRRKAKPATAIEGCEPKVFADEIAVYLARAAEEKQRAASTEIPAVNQRAEAVQPTTEELEWSPAYSEDEPIHKMAWSATPAPEPATPGWRSDLLDRAPADEPAYGQSYVKPAAAWEQEAVSSETYIEQRESPEEEYVPAREDPEAPVEEVVVPIHTLVVPTEEVGTLAEPFETPVEEVAAPVQQITVAEQRFESVVVTAIAAPAVEDPKTPISPMAAESSIGAPLSTEPALVETSATEPQRHPVNRVSAVPKDRINAAINSQAASADDDPNAIKATPSFKAALEAIRAAWGKPTQEAAPGVVSHKDAPPGGPGATTRMAAEPVEAPAPVADEPGPFEVDLTGAVDPLDEQAMELERQAAALLDADVAQIDSASATTDVYELSASQDSTELEPVPSPKVERKREAARTTSNLVPAPVEPEMPEPARRAEPSSDRRKRSGKRASKPAKAKTPSRPQAQPTAAAAQDEWGIFDPNRCGFAALVDKLDKVSDEKTEKRRTGSKVRVISYS
jgi:hypothetical protein